MFPTAISLKAKWIFPITTPPRCGDWLNLRSGRIDSIAREPKFASRYDLGNVALLPGLVNAHTHLDLSDWPEPGDDIRDRGQTMADWVPRVLDHRRSASHDAPRAIARGMRECWSTGTVAVGDIVQEDWDPESETPLHVTAFREIIGWSPEDIAPKMEAAERFLKGFPPLPSRRAGLAPHAPQTVHRELLERMVDLSRERKIPLTMHLAESPEEMQLLEEHSGPLLEMMRRFDDYAPGAVLAGSRPLDYLELLSKGHRALVVHGTFLHEREIERLRVDRERLFLIWCPRSNAFFHPGIRPPVDAMLAANASVAMGTDSRASSPDLNLWNELRFAMEQQPEISPKSLLRMATLNGARALGIENRYGSLKAGKSAHLAAVSLPRNISSDDENEACRKLLGCRQIGPLEALLAELETG